MENMINKAEKLFKKKHKLPKIKYFNLTKKEFRSFGGDVVWLKSKEKYKEPPIFFVNTKIKAVVYCSELIKKITKDEQAIIGLFLHEMYHAYYNHQSPIKDYQKRLVQEFEVVSMMEMEFPKHMERIEEAMI